MSQWIQLAKGIVCTEEVLLQKQTLRLIGAREQIKQFFHNTSKMITKDSTMVLGMQCKTLFNTEVVCSYTYTEFSRGK